MDAQNKLSEYIKADFSYKSQIIQVVDLCKNSKMLFESSTVEDKNSLLKFLLTNCEVKEKKLVYQVNSPFSYILDLERSMMLPLVDKFRTLNWTSIKSELEFSGILGLFPTLTLQN